MRVIFKAIACASLIFGHATLAGAEAIASDRTSLGGLSDDQCVRKVDGIINREAAASSEYMYVVRGEYTRRIFYTDGSVDFACFMDEVVILVYFNNAGDQLAQEELDFFLDLF